MVAAMAAQILSVNEAACVTSVPLKQVHRIIDTGLLGSATDIRSGSRVILRGGLVGLKLAHETMDVLTLDGRRRLIRYLFDNPKAKVARDRSVSVDVRLMKYEVRSGLSLLARARRLISTDEAVLGGAACIKGTRIPAHDVADMLANGDDMHAIREAYPALAEEQVEAAALYARAYPRRGRPRGGSFWRNRKPAVSSEVAFDDLPPSR